MRIFIHILFSIERENMCVCVCCVKMLWICKLKKAATPPKSNSLKTHFNTNATGCIIQYLAFTVAYLIILIASSLFVLRGMAGRERNSSEFDSLIILQHHRNGGVKCV